MMSMMNKSAICAHRRGPGVAAEQPGVRRGW
jgi:hypothetical protein